ncbi:MAG: serine/threonine protein phosphatase [Caloramator sp.]|uniref:metallophosphoesterase n=1 Tax=Caloramator sp. TaxID=1871330 RepID=UPI001D4779C5|nr:metallophosphoesterase [Caloramator sp.]MBZ4664327.1 serine/threonine protein phosphatase [Caloramator sp.]
MALYAISDLHLSLSTNKPMDVFGDLWREHHLKIKENWQHKIKEDDVVLIAGDISWAMKLEEAYKDLEFIHSLNGKKVFIKGNHDYWWTSITKINSLFEDMYFIQNTHFPYNEYAISGTRGWINLENTDDEHDIKVHKRELLRLKMSLDSAKKAGYEKFIVMMHYPPVTKIAVNQEFVDVLKEYGVEKVVYGHIHYDARYICENGIIDGIEYICTSCDIIDFNPVRIL